jgi:hypothetical protein
MKALAVKAWPHLAVFAERCVSAFATAFLAAVTVGSQTRAHDLVIGAVAGGYAVIRFVLDAAASLKP